MAVQLRSREQSEVHYQYYYYYYDKHHLLLPVPTSRFHCLLIVHPDCTPHSGPYLVYGLESNGSCEMRGNSGVTTSSKR